MRLTVFVSLLIAAIVVASGCSERSGHSESTKQAETLISDEQFKLQTKTQVQGKAQTVEATDFNGNLIQLEKPAERVIALAPNVVENVFSAGAGQQLIGVVQYSDFPEQAKRIPIVGGFEKINFERIIELNPDLIIAWGSGNSHSAVSRLKKLGYSVYIDQPNSLYDIAKSIKDIGVLTGHAEQAIEVADSFINQLNNITRDYRGKIKLSSFYQVWNKPLQTISGNHIISHAIEICGGVNIYADEISVAPIINIESVLQRNPQAIIASGTSNSRPEWLNDWTQWTSLAAVQANNLFFVNADHIQRHTVRTLLGINSICQQLDSARAKLTVRE